MRIHQSRFRFEDSSGRLARSLTRGHVATWIHGKRQYQMLDSLVFSKTWLETLKKHLSFVVSHVKSNTSQVGQYPTEVLSALKPGQRTFAVLCNSAKAHNLTQQLPEGVSTKRASKWKSKGASTWALEVLVESAHAVFAAGLAPPERHPQLSQNCV